MRRSRIRKIQRLPHLTYVLLDRSGNHWLSCVADGLQRTGKECFDLERLFAKEGGLPPDVVLMKAAGREAICAAMDAPELGGTSYQQAGPTMVMRDGVLVPKG